jgi:HlyD family secretion protein
MAAGTPRDEGPSIRRHLVGGAIIALMLTGGLGGWAATTELSGAVIASGSVVVDSNVKKVQHLTGGIVGELLVRDGSRVRAGDVVLRLDETIMRANLAIVVKGLAEMHARQARLASERDRAEEIAFAPALARSGRRARDRQRAQTVRAPAQRARRAEGAAQGAHQPTRRGGPGSRRAPAGQG